MKTALLMAVAAFGLCTTSCQKDDTYTPTSTTQTRESTEEPTARNHVKKPATGKAARPDLE